MSTTNPAAPLPPTISELRSLMAEELRSLETDELLSRYRFARTIGATFNGARDMYQVLGYATVLTVEDYRERYERGGLAGSIVDVFPDATWRGDGGVVEDDNPEVSTAFEQAWDALSDRLSLWPRFCKADKLSRLSTYSGLILGTAEGELSQELPRSKAENADGIIYVDAYCGAGGWRMSGTRQSRRRVAMAAASDVGADLTIREFDTDPKSKRFGLPKLYTLRRPDLNMGVSPDIHWSRVIHVAENTLDDEVFGQPALARPWNLLDDLDKVAGGGAEAFWNRANRGMQLDIDKDVKTLSDPEKAELKTQVEQYVHEMSRVLRTRGVTIKELGSDVANFSSPGDFIITLIAGTCRIPKRILTGSEMGELASTQDRENFRDTVIGRQTGYAGPMIVRRFTDRLIEYGYLPKPAQYKVFWPHTQVLTEQERSAGATAWATVNAQAMAATGEVLFTNDEIREKWYGLPPLTDEQRVPKNAPKEAPAPAAALAPK